MKNREFVMLAEKYDASKHNIAGYLASEKRDGMRALWLPTTKGIPTSQIRFANTEKDGRLINEPIATGLWSRYGKVIHCPQWWSDNLPDYPLDGELYLGRGRFQEMLSVVKAFSGTDWTGVEYRCFDAPTYDEIFLPGKINNPNYKKMIGLSEKLSGAEFSKQNYFEMRYEQMRNRIPENDVLKVEPQLLLPHNQLHAEQLLNEKLLEITKGGGEGLIVRSPVHTWNPVRSKHMLKIKPIHDAEAVVVGVILGTKRLEGMMGALRVHWNGKVFDIGTGFTDQQRILGFKCNNLPGEFVAHEGLSLAFPIGTKLTFLYRELTDEGIPKEARFFRRI